MLCCAMICHATQVFCSKIGLAPYIEVALYHKKAKALMVTDAVVYIPDEPPEASLYALLSCMPMSGHNAGHEQESVHSFAISMPPRLV